MCTRKVASPSEVHGVSTGSVLFPRPADKIPLLAKFRGVRLLFNASPDESPTRRDQFAPQGKPNRNESSLGQS
jgi:hypothetical protein